MILLNRQQTIILQALRQSGERGVNSYDLRFKFHLIQAPVRIKELKEKGFLIATRDKKDRSVDYILIHGPEADKIMLHGEKIKEETPKQQYEFIGSFAYPVNKIPVRPIQEVLF